MLIVVIKKAKENKNVQYRIPVPYNIDHLCCLSWFKIYNKILIFNLIQNKL